MKHARIRQMAFFFGGVFAPRLTAFAPTPLSALEKRRIEQQVGLGQRVALDDWQRPTLPAPPPAMLNLLDDLRPTVRLMVLLDWPLAWASPTLAALGDVEIVDLANLGAFDSATAQFIALLAHGLLRARHSLTVEPITQRALAALDCGLDVAIYEDEPRLRRDLGLWGLV